MANYFDAAGVEDLESRFQDALDEMLDLYGAEAVLFRLQKRLEGRLETHGYTELLFTELAAVREAQEKIGNTRYEKGF